MTIRPGLLALTLLLTLSGQAQAYSYAAAGKEPLIDAREWLPDAEFADGHHATMQYLARGRDRRADPRRPARDLRCRATPLR